VPEPTAAELAAFQHALLDLLYRDLPPEEVQAQLRSGEAFRPFQDYLSRAEPRMMEVAAELVKKWGRRSGQPAPGVAPQRG
jgi:hypothetical protein